MQMPVHYALHVSPVVCACVRKCTTWPMLRSIFGASKDVRPSVRVRPHGDERKERKEGRTS